MSDMHEIQQFSPIDPDRFLRECADIKAKTGIEITQDEGEATARGITIRWKYDRVAQSLEVQTMKRSWFDPPEYQIDQQIHVEIEGTK